MVVWIPYFSFFLVSGLAGLGAMASQLVREWIGIQQFPAATQTRLSELLGKLKQEV